MSPVSPALPSPSAPTGSGLVPLLHGAPVVLAEGLARCQGTRWALRGVDLRIPAGRIVMVCGANGSGKTTLIRLLGTALSPTKGTLQLFGGRFGEPTGPDVRARVAMLSHADHHYDDLTAQEHLDLVAALLPARSDRPTAADLLARVGLSARSGSLVRTFSAGMRKRLAFARLLQKQADLVLLDEPYAALDPQGAALVDSLLDEFRDQGRTVLTSTHQVERAAARAEHAVRLDGGRVTWAGPARDAASSATDPG